MVINPRTFISFDFDNDEKQRMLFVGQSKNSRTPFNIQDWSSKQHLPQRSWEATIEDKISRCHMVLILVGPHTHTAIGVKKEIEMAMRNNVPYYGIYVAGANDYTPLPPGLTRSRVIRWDWDKIASAIQRMEREGKNA